MMSSGSNSPETENPTHNFSEAKLARVYYAIVRTLWEKRLISRDPLSIRIERSDRNPIPPCARSYGPDPVDMSQLEWAAQNGRFWFAGLVKSLNIIIDKGPRQGRLELEPNKMKFMTWLNILNLENTEIVVKRIKESSGQFGVLCHFDQPRNSYNLVLTLYMEKTLSQQNVNEFLKKIQEIIPNNAKTG